MLEKHRELTSFDPERFGLELYGKSVAIADADRAKSARGEIASFSKMLEAEVFETFPPDFPDEPGSNLTPGFRNFSPKVAVKLIQQQRTKIGWTNL